MPSLFELKDNDTIVIKILLVSQAENAMTASFLLWSA